VNLVDNQCNKAKGRDVAYMWCTDESERELVGERWMRSDGDHTIIIDVLELIMHAFLVINMCVSEVWWKHVST